MNLEEMKKRLGEIVAKLGEYNALETFQSEDVEAINELNAEFKALKQNIETKEMLEEMNASATVSTRKVEASKANTPKVVVGETRNQTNHGFESAGKFFSSVVDAANGRVDKRLSVQNTAFEKYAEDGAYLIPSDFRTEILEKVTGQESLLSRTFQLTSSSNHISLPIDEVAPWDGAGIQAYWEGEGATYTESKGVFGQANMRLHKLTSLVKVSDELLEDAPALESYIRRKAPEAMLHKVNSAIIDGTGAGQPFGLLSSGFKVTVAKEAGQAADTIVFENIVKMYSRQLPMGISKSVWIINPQIQEQLKLMKFDTAAASPVPAYMPPSGLSGAPYGTLMGLPILPMMGGSKALGDEGDIVLVDLSHYISVVKTGGINAQASSHVYFDRDLQAFKFSMRIAGQCPYKAPVRTENGAYDMSGIVTLADRA